MHARLHSPVTHAVLFGVALAFTPVVLMMNRLPQAISRATNLGLPVLGREVPLVPVVAIGLLAVLCVVARRHVTRVRVAAGAGHLQEAARIMPDNRVVQATLGRALGTNGAPGGD